MIVVDPNSQHLLVYHVWMEIANTWQTMLIHSGAVKADELFRIYNAIPSSSPLHQYENITLSTSLNLKEDMKYVFQKGFRSDEKGMLFPYIMLCMPSIRLPKENPDDPEAAYVLYGIFRDADTRELQIALLEEVFDSSDPDKLKQFRWTADQLAAIVSNIESEIRSGEEHLIDYMADSNDT